jgi:DNA-binding GntR family transcriptional regulator
MADRVDRNSPVELRVQAAAILRRQIMSGERMGKLPSETDLARELGVTKDPTLRAALAILEREGLVRAVHRRGWFVIIRTAGE